MSVIDIGTSTVMSAVDEAIEKEFTPKTVDETSEALHAVLEGLAKCAQNILEDLPSSNPLHAQYSSRLRVFEQQAESTLQTIRLSEGASCVNLLQLATCKCCCPCCVDMLAMDAGSCMNVNCARCVSAPARVFMQLPWVSSRLTIPDMVFGGCRWRCARHNTCQAYAGDGNHAAESSS